MENILYHIEIDDWDSFVKNRGRCLWFEGEKIFKCTDREHIKTKRFFAMGKYFIFILLCETRGLKILYRNSIYEKKKIDVLSKMTDIIKIQKTFYRNNISFDCEERVFKVFVRDRSKGTKYEFYAYITFTDVDEDKVKNNIDNLNEISNNVYDIIFLKEKIGRRFLRTETSKRKNYVISKSGEVMFVDIDPNFYFVKK